MIKCIIFSLIVALILTMLPLPNWAQDFRPLWMLLTCLCWILIYPEQFGVGVAWTNGLILDSLQGTLLGENALCFALIAYTLIKMRHWFCFVSEKWQALIVFLLLLANQVLMFWLEGLQGNHVSLGALLGSAFTSALFWLWMYKLLQKIAQKFSMYESYQRSSHEYS